MSDISIRNVSEDVYAALKDKAAADGKGLETWLREQVILLAGKPTIRKRYAYRFAGPDAAYGTMKRYDDGVNSVGGGCKNLSEEQFKAYHMAQDFMRRNEVGDREKAYDLLKAHFEEVFEVPV